MGDKFNKALGIDDDLNDIDSQEDSINDDDEKRRKHEERKQHVQEVKNKLKNLNKVAVEDKDYCRDVYKDVVSESLAIMNIMRYEIENDPSPRAVETFAALGNSIASTLKNLRELDVTDQKLEIDREKIEVKKMNANTAANIGNGMVSTMSDMMKFIRKTHDEIEEEKLIETEVEIVDEDSEETVDGESEEENK